MNITVFHFDQYLPESHNNEQPFNASASAAATRRRLSKICFDVVRTPFFIWFQLRRPKVLVLIQKRKWTSCR